MSRLAALVSGGQSGVDRAALDVAVALGLDYGGHVPAGGWAEDFPEPPGVLAAYPKLVELAGADPDERTVRNVCDSDATLVVTVGGCSSPGTDRTIRAALDLGKPCLVTNGTDVDEVAHWLQSLGGRVRLNVAGPRRSEWPQGYDVCRALLGAVLR
jgi:hypothetical protein